jgi:hypothetical protein
MLVPHFGSAIAIDHEVHSVALRSRTGTGAQCGPAKSGGRKWAAGESGYAGLSTSPSARRANRPSRPFTGSAAPHGHPPNCVRW